MNRLQPAQTLFLEDLDDDDPLEDLDDDDLLEDLDDDAIVVEASGYDGDDGDRYDLRDDVLGIETMADDDEVSRFSGLGLAGVAVLFEEGLLDPDVRQNQAPSALECVGFLCRWPEVTLHGFALHPRLDSDGGTVRVEGLACELSLVDEARREALLDAFDAFTRGATGRVDTPEILYAMWR